ncbi:MAG: DNA modification methylase [Gammaproteobacteria bacterium]|nr:DNA modification methylase [Gammaproteobacteria bacterium]NIV51110.1 DNA methylase [Gammaproteobacteria bacterium]NIX85052.1 DNA methylase [Gammaproteobacteria bacterium]
MTDDERTGLRRSLEKHGDIGGITFNRRTGRLVSGHQRVRELREMGAVYRDGAIHSPQGGSWPVRVVDWSESDEIEANVTANNPHIASDYDDTLEPLLRELRGTMGEVDFGEAQLDKLLGELSAPTGEAEQDEVPEPPTEPVTRPGDVWTLGEHRLICGDSTDETAVALAYGGMEPFIMVTDPPYGVEYDGAWRNNGLKRRSPGESVEGGVLGDNRCDWSAAYALFPGMVAYVWAPYQRLSVFVDTLAAVGFIARSIVAWVKPQATISRGHYHPQWEPCIYAVRKGATARWVGDSKQTTVWAFGQTSGFMASTEDKTPHPTQKPLECMSRPIRNHGTEGDVVYDPFSGSGTTLIAAERLGRRCRAVEIEPRYCDVAVERWEQLTGGKAKRVAS